MPCAGMSERIGAHARVHEFVLRPPAKSWIFDSPLLLDFKFLRIGDSRSATDLIFEHAGIRLSFNTFYLPSHPCDILPRERASQRQVLYCSSCSGSSPAGAGENLLNHLVPRGPAAVDRGPAGVQADCRSRSY